MQQGVENQTWKEARGRNAVIGSGVPATSAVSAPDSTFREARGRDIAALLDPRPVIIVGSVGRRDEVGFATIIWATPVSHEPPMVAFSLRARSHTMSCIQISGHFSLNVLPPTAEGVFLCEQVGTRTGFQFNKNVVVKHRIEEIEHEGVPFSGGDWGFEGAEGASVADGARDVRGARGARGARGDEGARGARGARGDEGARGARGVRSDEGAHDAQINQGAQGVEFVRFGDEDIPEDDGDKLTVKELFKKNSIIAQKIEKRRARAARNAGNAENGRDDMGGHGAQNRREPNGAQIASGQNEKNAQHPNNAQNAATQNGDKLIRAKVPIVNMATSYMICSVCNITEAGDHLLVTGKVERAYTTALKDAQGLLTPTDALMCIQHGYYGKVEMLDLQN